MWKKGLSLTLILNIFIFSNMSFAATATAKKVTTTKIPLPKLKTFTVSAWVPYWRAASGTEEIIKNINKVDIISPFSFEMTETGTFKDPMKLDKEPYKSMIDVARKNKKLIVPSILWWAEGDMRESMDFVLRDADLRSAVIYDIKDVIKKYNLDGIDIDFENKKAESKDVFTKFLTELSAEMHRSGKLLVCTIEARTPIDSKYTTVTAEVLKNVQYANDFKAIGKVCDQVRIMAYDQANDDKQLNASRGEGYKPVADIDWVEKVLTLAMRDIEWKKIIVGVPTYGYKYEVIRDTTGKITKYSRIGSMNWFYADELAKELKITPTRHVSGELNYTYKKDGKEYLVWYSDAESIKQKVTLAKLYKIGGIAIFKIDGNNDQNIWKNL